MSMLNEKLEDMTIITKTDRWVANELSECIDEYAKAHGVDSSLYDTYGYVDVLLDVVEDNIKNDLLQHCVEYALVDLYEDNHLPTWDCGGGKEADELFTGAYKLTDIKVAYEDEIANGDAAVKCFEKYFVDKLDYCLNQQQTVKDIIRYKEQER